MGRPAPSTTDVNVPHSCTIRPGSEPVCGKPLTAAAKAATISDVRQGAMPHLRSS